MISINKTLYTNYLRFASEIWKHWIKSKNQWMQSQQTVLAQTNKTQAPAAKPDASKHET